MTAERGHDAQGLALSCTLFGFATPGAVSMDVVSRLDLGWRPRGRDGVMSFSADVPISGAHADVGIALDAVSSSGEPILGALAGEPSVQVDVALWFGAAGEPSTAVFSGDWLARCGRSFELWAEVEHAESDPRREGDPPPDRVTVSWSAGDDGATVDIEGMDTIERQRRLEAALHEAMRRGARRVRIGLHARTGIAGIVIPDSIVQAFRDHRTDLEISGERS